MALGLGKGIMSNPECSKEQPRADQRRPALHQAARQTGECSRSRFSGSLHHGPSTMDDRRSQIKLLRDLPLPHHTPSHFLESGLVLLSCLSQTGERSRSRFPRCKPKNKFRVYRESECVRVRFSFRFAEVLSHCSHTAFLLALSRSSFKTLRLHRTLTTLPALVFFWRCKGSHSKPADYVASAGFLVEVCRSSFKTLRLQTTMRNTTHGTITA